MLHALVYQGESLIGHMELWLGPSTDRGFRFESEDLRAAGAAQLEFRVALIDTRPRRLQARSAQVRFWTLTSAQVQIH